MRLLTFLLLLPTVLISDTKTVVKTTSNCCVTVNTSYAQGEKRRYENESGPTSFRGAVHTATIISGHQIEYQLDLQAKQYTEHPLPNPFQSPPLLRALPPRLISSELLQPQSPTSGKLVDSYFETVDTGETKEIFGKIAHHLILRTRTVAEPGACEQSRTSQREGWYVVKPQPAGQRYFMMAPTLEFIAKQCHDKKRIHGAFPFLQAMVETDADGSKSEFLELSDAPLDPHLFDLPAGFSKVGQLPPPPLTWDQQISQQWTLWTKLIQSWFN